MRVALAVCLSFLLVFQHSCVMPPAHDSDGDGVPDHLDPEPGLAVSFQLVQSVPVETHGIRRDDIPETAEVWLELFASAKTSLDIAQFYINHEEGRAMEQVLKGIVQARDRGVRVRVLIEKGMEEVSAKGLEVLNKAGIEVALIDYKAIDGVDGILHAKYFIVDQRIVFLGSQNFDWKALTHIHELGLKIESRNLALVLGRIFEDDWAFATRGEKLWSIQHPDSDGDGIPDWLDPNPAVPYWEKGSGPDIDFMRLYASPQVLNPQGVLWSADAIVELIDGARESVVMQALSYSLEMYNGETWDVFDKALRRAVARGVSVRLNLADWSKKSPRIEALKDLVRAGVEVKFNTIPQHSEGWLEYSRVDHSKYAVADSKKAWLGTSNWSGDYFLSTRNLDIIFSHRVVIPKLLQIFNEYWVHPYSETLDPEKDYVAPVYKTSEEDKSYTGDEI